MRDQRGQTSVLIIGFAVVLLLMVGVVVDSSAAYLQRQGLDTLADGAALAGADEVRGSGVYEDGLTGERAPLDAAAARAAVQDYLTGIGAYDDHPGLSFDVAVRDRWQQRIRLRQRSASARLFSNYHPAAITLFLCAGRSRE